MRGMGEGNVFTGLFTGSWCLVREMSGQRGWVSGYRRASGQRSVSSQGVIGV